MTSKEQNRLYQAVITVIKANIIYHKLPASADPSIYEKAYDDAELALYKVKQLIGIN